MLGLAALLLLLMAGVSYEHWTHYRRANHHAAQAEDLLEAVERLLTTLLDAETGQRGFLLPGDECYLEPYTHAIQSVDSQVLQLTHALAPFQGEGDEGTPLPRLMEHKLAELRETIALSRTHGLSAALEVVRTGQGKRAMDEVRRRCAHLRYTLSAVLREERAQVEAYAQRTHFVTTGGALLLFAFLLAASFTLHRTMRHRAHALSESQALRELLERTLASIGDAVITTDAAPERLDEMPQILERIKQGTRVEHYETMRRTKGGQVVQVSLTVSPIHDASGRIIGASKIARDITKLRRLEEELRHAQKMEALGTLAGGIAHDFNNMLAAILGYAELLQDEIPVGSPARTWLQRVLTASLRAKALVQQILAFSRRTPVARTPVSLAAVLHETLPFLRALLPSTIAMEDHLTAEATLVLADATQMQQILMNLGTNARDAMGDTGGRLAIHLEVVEVDAAFAALHPALGIGPYVRLTMRASGAGIPPAMLARIFEPFFTTKEVGHGTGLGLAAVHGIVESHGGTILVESTLGQGTTFMIYLPRLVEPAEGDTHPAVTDRPGTDT